MAAQDESSRAKLEQLQKLRDESMHAGSEQAVERQHQQGKMLARERLDKLLDAGSFVELDRYVRHREPNFGMLERRPYGDAVVTGYGTIFGRKVFVFSQDFTVFGGSLSEVFAEKICKISPPSSDVRSSGSTTRAGRASRRASSRWLGTRRSSGATSNARA